MLDLCMTIEVANNNNKVYSRAFSLAKRQRQNGDTVYSGGVSLKEYTNQSSEEEAVPTASARHRPSTRK